jgi:cytochrome b6-f complex iron-sulfur subunit
MNRKDFLKSLGISGAAIFATYCAGGLTSCTSDSNTPASVTDFTLDLTLPANKSLNTNGGYVIANNVVVARTNTGSYVAVTKICSHEGNPNITFDGANNRFSCSSHGALFDIQGKGTNANGSRGLKTYQTVLTGTMLRVIGS